ncbi:macrosialin [Denticeps clupeoides]|uniref:macrosialin n=1 Tax=Denticeps clupeoides TaxID=299321 RepID=UPI0010A45F3A|nr:macrosialin-like [Denticeps clupeoides]
MRGPGLLITAYLLASVVSGQEDRRHTPSASLQPPAEFTSQTPLTSAGTMPAPTTTAKSANTTTPAPTTTTPAPTTTTKSPNTTTPAPTTTTPAPTTTTKSPNTTTPAPTIPGPTPPTNLTVGNYTLRNGTSLCVMAQMALQVRVNNSQAVGVFIVQPDESNPAGDCSKDTVNLSVNFTQGYINFTFTRNASTSTVYASSLALMLTYSFQQGAPASLFQANNGSLELFKAAASHSYSCKNESVFLGNGIYLDVSQDRIQAYNFTRDMFGEIDLCPADKPNYTLPIVVGIILLVLILVVVLVYVLSRRRRSEGYQPL